MITFRLRSTLGCLRTGAIAFSPDLIYPALDTTSSLRSQDTSSLSSDCYDSNPDACPTHTSFHSSDRGDGSYDYNCDGSQERRWTTESDSCAFFSDLGCSAANGWNGSSPSCGNTGTWREECYYSSSGWPWEWGCYWASSASRTQTCR